MDFGFYSLSQQMGNKFFKMTIFIFFCSALHIFGQKPISRTRSDALYRDYRWQAPGLTYLKETRTLGEFQVLESMYRDIGRRLTCKRRRLLPMFWSHSRRLYSEARGILILRYRVKGSIYFVVLLHVGAPERGWRSALINVHDRPTVWLIEWFVEWLIVSGAREWLRSETTTTWFSLVACTPCYGQRSFGSSSMYNSVGRSPVSTERQQ